jgi:hypothetical protein
MSSTAGDRLKRNLFEIDNARNLTRDEIVRTFVPTESFWRMLSAKHHILLGARGSGKTAIAKMLSHDHLSLWEDERARVAVQNKSFIGIYLPTKLEWVASIASAHSEDDAFSRANFYCRLNIAACMAFINTLRSCLESYCRDRGERARVERSVVTQLAAVWTRDQVKADTTTKLFAAIEGIEYGRQQELASRRASGRSVSDGTLPGVAFEIDLFRPLRIAIQITSSAFRLPESTSWLLCIDEAEFLTEEQQVVLNSLMRSNTGNLFFKITTMPYYHVSTATLADVPLLPGHDYEYVYLDQDPTLRTQTPREFTPIGTQFARQVLTKRFRASGGPLQEIDIDELLGSSEILDPMQRDWSSGSENMKLLAEYASPETLARARELASSDKVGNEIRRKIYGAMILRHKVATLRGHRGFDAYGGASMAIRCSDSNPRRLIRIFNDIILVSKIREEGGRKKHQPVSASRQTAILRKQSNRMLSAVKAEPKYGADLHSLLERLGRRMQRMLHERPLATDQVSAFSLSPDVAEEYWSVVRMGVGIGMLYPIVNDNDPDELPVKEGTFRLAFGLAPHFLLVPRRGKDRSLISLLALQEDGDAGDRTDVQFDLFETEE